MKKLPQKKFKKETIEDILRDSYTGSDVKRYIGAVTEEFHTRVSAVAEQIGGLYEIVADNSVKLTDLDERVKHLDKKVDHLDKKVDHLDKKVDHLDKKVDHLDKKVDHLDKKVENLDKKVDRIDSQVGRLEQTSDRHTEMLSRLLLDGEDIKIGMQEKVSKIEFNKLETRLVALETFVFTERGKAPTKVRK